MAGYRGQRPEHGGRRRAMESYGLSRRRAPFAALLALAVVMVSVAGGMSVWLSSRPTAVSSSPTADNESLLDSDSSDSPDSGESGGDDVIDPGGTVGADEGSAEQETPTSRRQDATPTPRRDSQSPAPNGGAATPTAAPVVTPRPVDPPATDKPVATARPSVTPTAAPVPPPAPAFRPVRINTGGPAFTEPDGTVWVADNFFIGGFENFVDAPINGTDKDFLYQSERFGMTGYRIPVANGTHRLNLRFAEINPTSGTRLISATAEGKSILADFEISGKGRGPFFAVNLEWTVVITDGFLDLGFSASRNSSSIAAIEIS